MSELQEPQGVPFYNIKSDETHYAKMEAQIQAYINSSDMGINASRDQDFGWRLGADWVKRVKAFRRDETKMSILTNRNNGQKPTTVQILYYLYGEDLRNFEEYVDENANPFEDKYRQEIADQPERSTSSDEITDDVDDADLEPASEQVEEVPSGDGGKLPTKAPTAKQK